MQPHHIIVSGVRHSRVASLVPPDMRVGRCIRAVLANQRLSLSYPGLTSTRITNILESILHIIPSRQ